MRVVPVVVVGQWLISAGYLFGEHASWVKWWVGGPWLGTQGFDWAYGALVIAILLGGALLARRVAWAVALVPLSLACLGLGGVLTVRGWFHGMPMVGPGDCPGHVQALDRCIGYERGGVHPGTLFRLTEWRSAPGWVPGAPTPPAECGLWQNCCDPQEGFYHQVACDDRVHGACFACAHGQGTGGQFGRVVVAPDGSVRAFVTAGVPIEREAVCLARQLDECEAP